MTFDIALNSESNRVSSEHLLHHYSLGHMQEDLCFALWRPSTGSTRRGAIIDHIVLPQNDERNLHGNVSFEPAYLYRAIQTARQQRAGLAFMHSHPEPGWQGMSDIDIQAERDVLAYPAQATGLPLVGLTLGKDGYWSGRFWERDGTSMRLEWCKAIRIVGPKAYRFHHNDNLEAPPPRKEILRRTFDTWGREAQDTIARLKVGIVGLGSVGCIVAETMARIGVAHVTLIDPDRVEPHNLDRLLYGTVADVGKLKVNVAARALRNNATAERIEIIALPTSIQNESVYKSALDCDILFSCVDRPVARDILNHIASAHLIPVIDGGIAVETDREKDRLFSAHWRTHIITPYHQCLRCNHQYDSSMVVAELDGSLDDPAYVGSLPEDLRDGNQNVFPFSLNAAGMQVNLMLRYILAPEWWPSVGQVDCQFVTAENYISNDACHENCSFRQRRFRGDAVSPHYLIRPDEPEIRP